MVDAERRRQAPDVAERQRLILEFLAGKSTSPGASVSVESSLTWPVGDCNNEGEFDWHLRELDRKGLIKFRSMTQRADAELTSEGWAALARDSGERIDRHRAFVAMSFATDLQPVWEEGFKPAIESAGYDAHRADSQPSTEAIDQKLIGDIRRSRFVIADVTHHRPNVYFEAGYALAMGKPVIWTVQEDHKKDLHFDTRQFPHLVWKDAAHLAEQLENFVAGAIGRLERPDRPVERT
jgi:nucleoside 2-deoxyribosyltransferase